MRTLMLALGFVLAAMPARAETISPADVKAHAGQTVTVEAAISDVHTGRSGVTFIDVGGRYPDSRFHRGDLRRRRHQISERERARRQDRGHQRPSAALSRQARDHPEIGGSAQSEVVRRATRSGALFGNPRFTPDQVRGGFFGSCSRRKAVRSRRAAAAGDLRAGRAAGRLNKAGDALVRLKAERIEHGPVVGVPFRDPVGAVTERVRRERPGSWPRRRPTAPAPIRES